MITIRDFFNKKLVTNFAVILASVPLVWIIINFLTQLMITKDGLPQGSPSEETKLLFASVAILYVYSFIYLPIILGSLVLWWFVTRRKMAHFLIFGFLGTTALATILFIYRFGESVWQVLD